MYSTHSKIPAIQKNFPTVILPVWCHVIFAASPWNFFLEKAGYDIWHCSFCGLSQTIFNKPYDRFVKEFYSKGYFTGDDTKSAYTKYADDKPFIVRNLKKHLDGVRLFKQKGTLLDVGCAMGYMVELARASGFDAYGCDPSEYALSQASTPVRSKLKLGSIDTVTYPKQTFDVITMSDVIEHVKDPLGNLKKLSTFLKKDGIFAIATGDTESIAAKIMKKRWTFYIPPQHLFFFTRKNLTTMLNAAGFEPVYWFRVNKWLSLQYVLHLAHTDSRFPFAGQLESIVAFLGLGNLPMFMPLRDNITVIARRKKNVRPTYSVLKRT